MELPARELSECGRPRSTGRSAYLCPCTDLACERVIELARREEERLGEGRVGLDRVEQHVERDLGANRERELLEPLPRLRADRDGADEHPPLRIGGQLHESLPARPLVSARARRRLER